MNLRLDSTTSTLKQQSPSSVEHSPTYGHNTLKKLSSPVEPLEIQIEPNISTSPKEGLLTDASKMINTNSSNDNEQKVVVVVPSPRLKSPGQSINQTENVSYFRDKKITCGSFVL
jgi:hypothetical protein